MPGDFVEGGVWLVCESELSQSFGVVLREDVRHSGDWMASRVKELVDVVT
mgnify:CR=1 FL=1